MEGFLLKQIITIINKSPEDSPRLRSFMLSRPIYGDVTKILTFGTYVTETGGNTFKTFTKIPATSVFVNEGLQGIMGFDFDSDGNAYFVHNYRGGGYFFRMLPDNNNVLSFHMKEYFFSN